MNPPQEVNVIDKHGGFTALTRGKSYEKVLENGTFKEWKKVYKERNTLWRPCRLLKGQKMGILQEYDEDSFFQLNNDVTRAIYKVRGYCNRIALWFDNKTGERIA